MLTSPGALAPPSVLCAVPDRLLGDGASVVPERGLRAPSWGIATCAPCTAPLACSAALESVYREGGAPPAAVGCPVPIPCHHCPFLLLVVVAVFVPGDCRRHELEEVEVFPVSDKKNFSAAQRASGGSGAAAGGMGPAGRCPTAPPVGPGAPGTHGGGAHVHLCAHICPGLSQ